MKLTLLPSVRTAIVGGDLASPRGAASAPPTAGYDLTRNWPKSLPLLCVTLLACFGSAACSRSAADSKRVIVPEPAPAALYKAGRGLQLSPAALAFAGLQTADVANRDVASAQGVVAIPATALLRTAKGDFVFVSNGGWYLRTPVKIGGTAGGWLAVADGLYEGDTVVTHGVQALWLAEIQAVNGGVGCTEGH